MVWQLLQGFGRCAPARRQLLKRLAPYWCGANVGRLRCGADEVGGVRLGNLFTIGLGR